jgi:galactose mutarotase-like enzyme
VGGAILLPYANRIRGELLPDGQYLETTILGQMVRLPANWKGNEPGAEPHAMHGLVLDRTMDTVHYEADSNGARVIGKLAANDFNGHWLSKADIRFESELTGSFFGFRVTVENVGDEDLPMGIGWHPYFVFPSGKREQAKLHIPANQRALVNNYDDVFPTGELEALAGTHYDVSVSGGLALGDLFLDDCFIDLQKAGDGRVVAEIIDPEARYGLRVIGLSPEISAFQVYAPVDQAFVALEPQFNWADPYSSIWGGKDTGMVVLKPGDSVEYAVRLEVFLP